MMRILAVFQKLYTKRRRMKNGILSKSKGEATRLEGLGANNLYTELPRP